MRREERERKADGSACLLFLLCTVPLLTDGWSQKGILVSSDVLLSTQYVLLDGKCAYYILLLLFRYTTPTSFAVLLRFVSALDGIGGLQMADVGQFQSVIMARPRLHLPAVVVGSTTTRYTVVILQVHCHY